MSKGNRRVKNVSGTPVSSDAQARSAEYQARYGSIGSIEFPRAWLEARDLDPKLPEAPPGGIPDEAKRAIILLARRVLTLESEWS
jgi:hypothetical protein